MFFFEWEFFIFDLCNFGFVTFIQECNPGIKGDLFQGLGGIPVTF
jgi:hypothetical protein